jgi:LEA14-like dessication related protein
VISRSISRARSIVPVAGAVLTFGGLFGTGCQKPAPPHITPKEARVVAVSPQGLDILLKVEATNPNNFTLSAQTISAKAKLDNRWDMGSVTIAKPVVLPPNTPTMIDVPMTMPWRDLNALGALASAPAQKPVPYSVEGSAKIGGERLNVDVPFALSGTISREQIAGAAMKSFPSIPGVKLP